MKAIYMMKMKKILLTSSFLMLFPLAEQAKAYGGLVFVNQGQGGSYSSSNSSNYSSSGAKASATTSFGINSNSFSRNVQGFGGSLSTAKVTSSGFGRVPLWLAISQIVPQGYQTTFCKDINQNMNVTWESGSSVQTALNSIASQTHLNYDVSGNKISFTKGNSTAEQVSSLDSSASKKIGGAGGGVFHGQNQAKMTVHESKPEKQGYNEVYDKVDHYYGNKKMKGQKFPTSEYQLPSKPFSPADGGEGVYFAPAKSNLASVIESWAARSGWSVVNDTDDIYYPLMASASFKGTFTESVAAIVNSFKDASPYPRVTFYPNHVMRIYTSESAEN